MPISKATNLANVGSGIGTQPSQPIDFGAVDIDAYTGITTVQTLYVNSDLLVSGFGATIQNLTVPDTFTVTANTATFNHISTPSANVSGILTAQTLDVTGNVSIAGTLTYEDVTNVDSIGIITAQSGINVTGGIATVAGQTNLANVNVSAAGTVATLNVTGQTNLSNTNVTSGIVTVAGQTSLANVSVSAASTFSGKISANSGVGFTGFLREGINIVSGKLSDNTTINIDHSMAHYFTTAETTTGIPNFTSTAGINTDLSVGETFSVNVITTAAAAGYSTGARIDAGATLPVLWNGGDDPSEGGSSGVDVYTYQVIKTASATFTVLGNVSNFA
tara:strand:- start:1308 stop:2306 length:999 start_codon:yes stop_codon:yes gene_type:complete